MDEDNKGGFWNTKFLNEPAYRWMLFAIAATIFLFVWGRAVAMLAEGAQS